jgi:hypothetical protein
MYDDSRQIRADFDSYEFDEPDIGITRTAHVPLLPSVVNRAMRGATTKEEGGKTGKHSRFEHDLTDDRDYDRLITTLQ